MNRARRAKGLAACAALVVFLAGAAVYERLDEVSDAADYAQSAAEEAKAAVSDLESRVDAACEAHYC